MSHIAVMKSKRGKPVFRDRQALEGAARRLGLEVVETNVYAWYGVNVGGAPYPMKGRPGQNALFVLKVGEPKRSEFVSKYNRAPYDIGIIADPNNEGCFLPVYDYWQGGYGLSETVGEPVMNGREIEALCPKLIQHYHMECDRLAALEAGDHISFQEQPDGSWVSVTDTSARVQVAE